MIIEPCCISNQLPSLLRERPDVVFYSNGDWDVEKLKFSVDCMVDSPAVEILLSPAVDLSLCRSFRHSLQKNWAKTVFLCTTEDCTSLVQGELTGHADKVLYIHRDNLGSQLYVRYNANEMVAICGPMLLHDKIENDEHRKLCIYHGVFGSHGRKFKDIMDGIVPLFATRMQDKNFISEVKRNFLDRRYE